VPGDRLGDAWTAAPIAGISGRVCVCALDGPARPRYVRGLIVRQRSCEPNR
jgi:hypothetical protein